MNRQQAIQEYGLKWVQEQEDNEYEWSMKITNYRIYKQKKLKTLVAAVFILVTYFLIGMLAGVFAVFQWALQMVR